MCGEAGYGNPMVLLDPTPHPIDALPARGAPDAPALVIGGEVLSYAALERHVDRLAAWLAEQPGAAPGERVATWLSKTLTAVLMPLAAPRAGLVHVPINPALRGPQAAHILADSDAVLVVTGEARAEELRRLHVPTATAEGPDDSFDGYLRPSNAGPDALAALLYTSGSTGRPKGVMLSHANLWLGAISVAHYLELTPADRVLAALPLAFDYGQNQLFSAWAAGASVVPKDYLTARELMAAIGEGVTTLAGVPPLWRQLVEVKGLDDRAARLRRITNSGGALTPALIDALRVRFSNVAIYPMYGLTEAFRSTYLPPDLVAAHPDSIGRAIPFAEVMAVRADGTRAAPGEPGELVHAGPLVAQGYWRDAERTALRFRPAPVLSRYGGTAVWSGDTVVEDAEGLFRFVGREDEMIKSSGYRISPTEIEEAATRGGLALEAVAIGVPHATLGQSVTLVWSGPAGRENALRDALKRELPQFMQPAVYQRRDDLPKNANGKLDRAAIRAAVLG